MGFDKLKNLNLVKLKARERGSAKGGDVRRYYVTVHGGGDGLLLPANAGTILRDQAVANLRPLRVETGFDYAGLEIGGESLNAAPGLDMAGVRARMSPANICDTRIVVSHQAVLDGGTAEQGFGLVLNVSSGDSFDWRGGLSTVAADIRVRKELAGPQLSAVVLDIFQELMLAQCASIQSVLGKFTASGGTASDFYRAKADFANEQIANGNAVTLFEGYAPDRYASFAMLARTDFSQSLDRDERRRFADLWRRFLEARFADHFLTVDEAITLVRAGRFHRARPERTNGAGVPPGPRQIFGSIKEAKLRKVLGDRQSVLRTASYILCVLTGKPSIADIGKVGALFGWKNMARQTPERLRLCTDASYQQMVPLVRRGLVTPMRLFLKAS